MLVETIKVNGHKVDIYVDEDAPNPREDWDNFGKMVCWHSRYKLGDEHNYDSPSDFMNTRENSDVILPLYLYDHSGITMSTSPFSCPWDSGQVGWIYCTADDLKNEGVTADKAEQILDDEVEVYNQYLLGEVYGCVIDDDHEQSCWGFYGLDYIKEEIKAIIDK